MAKTELFVRHSPGGVFVVNDESKTTGNIFFVDSGQTTTGADAAGYGEHPDKPFLTVDYAIGKCTANNGDIIYVMPGHAETVTAAITCDIAGVAIIGLGRGADLPTLTGSGAIDVITITAASVQIKNLILVGAAADVTALINVAAADVEIAGCVFKPAETPLSCITVESGHRLYLHDFKAISSANGPDYFVKFESSASDDWIIENGFLNFTATDLDLAAFGAPADTTEGGILRNVVCIGLKGDGTFVDFNSSSAVGEGIIVDCSWQHIEAATIASGLDLGGYGTAFSGGGADGPVRAAKLLPATSAT